MKRLITIYLLCIIQIEIPCSSVAHPVYYVKPLKNTTCPYQHCRELNDYGNETEYYFENNTMIVFLPGNHQLNTRIIFRNISNARFVANSNESSTVFISSTSALRWVSCQAVIVTGLIFVVSGSSTTVTSPALSFFRSNVTLSNIQLHHKMRVNSITVSFSTINIHDLHISGIANDSGRAMLVNNSIINFTGSNSFQNCTSFSSGGALMLQESTAYFDGNVSFNNNRVFIQNSHHGGGAILCAFSHIIFSGSALFQQNEATTLGMNNSSHAAGGAILFQNNSSIVFLAMSESLFTQNIAFGDGGAIYAENSNLTFEFHLRYSSMDERARCNFNNNRASYGGAIFMQESKLTTAVSGQPPNSRSTVSFLDNFALYGGALFANLSSIQLMNVLFQQNEARWYGGAICQSGHGSLQISLSEFRKNAVKTDGGAVWIRSVSDVRLTGLNYFEENCARNGGTFWVASSSVTQYTFRISGNNTFVENHATKTGGCIYISRCTVLVTDTQTFVGNTADQGGAIAFTEGTVLTLNETVYLNFTDNHAKHVGGGIYYADNVDSTVGCRPFNTSIQKIDDFGFPDCFIELGLQSTIELHFIQNTAGLAGTALHGGNLDKCHLYLVQRYTFQNKSIPLLRIKSNVNNPINVFRNVSSTINNEGDFTSKISSGPRRVCLCEKNHVILCRPTNITITRGVTISLDVAIVGQANGIIPSTVVVSTSNDFRLDTSQDRQYTRKTCSSVYYRPTSVNDAITLSLYADSICYNRKELRQLVYIQYLPCPDGFALKGGECVCEHRVQKYTTSCNVEQKSIHRETDTFWIGVVHKNGSYAGLIIYPFECPLDYCVKSPVTVTLDDIHVQCNFNRSGILCSSCKAGYSIALGTLHCKHCNNKYLSLLLPFVLTGIALVVLLFLLKISVADGTLNGVIFYAHVIHANRLIFLPFHKTNVLTVFIAWLNLDLGIESCFFNGMDVYAFAWLQFLIPFYIWFLIGVIIVTSHFSRKVAKCLGTNPISVLATLILLSYTKILRSVVFTLSWTYLEYPNVTIKTVWLYDGSVPYFQRLDHIILGGFAIMVLNILFLPYTFLLLFGQCFQANSNLKIFSWINRIKPLMDAYHAPYVNKAHYWTGLLLLVRCVFVLLSAVRIDSKIVLLVTFSLTSGLATIAWVHKLYTKAYNDALEACSILNLSIFAAATYHLKVTHGNQEALAYVSVGISFVTFVLIMAYHIYSQLWTKLKTRFSLNIIHNNIISKKLRSLKKKDTTENEKEEHQIILSTSIELRECLLEQ